MQSDVIYFFSSDFPTFGLINNVNQLATKAAVGYAQEYTYRPLVVSFGLAVQRVELVNGNTYFFLQVIRLTLNQKKTKYTHIKLYHICSCFIGWYLHLGLLHCYYTSYTVSWKEV